MQGGSRMTTQWENISQNAKDTMQILGNFGPTVWAWAMEVKGWSMCEDGFTHSCHYNSNDLKNIAAGCLEVAQWLEERAMAEDEDC
jgi:hypothetical protein